MYKVKEWKGMQTLTKIKMNQLYYDGQSKL